MQKNVLLCAAILMGPSLAWAQSILPFSLPVDPNQNWRILETKHFEIIYDANNKNLAQQFANEAERADTLLQPLLNIHVGPKIPIVVADITDSSNGSATGIPRSQIEIYPVLPSVTDPTSEYANWVREVVTHEYTHILNFEPTSGFMSVLRFLLGSIIKPGGFLPRWYTEGLAVEMESRLTPVGRGRSHYYSALVRSQVEDKKWGNETIDKINSTDTPTWPRGQRPYTYGYFLMHSLSELPNHAGPQSNIYGTLNDRYGGRVPWFINGPIEEYFGFDYSGALGKMYEDLSEKSAGQLVQLESGGAQNGKPFNQVGYFNFGSQISPDGLKMAAFVSEVDDYPGIRIWTRKSINEPFGRQTEIPQALTKAKDMHQLSWRGDSRHIIFDHSDTWRHFDTYSDLYDLDTVTKEDKRLTKGMRAREATVMPDGSLVFVVATSTNTQLMHSDDQGTNPVLLYAPADGDRVSTPRPYKDGVIYSHRDGHGHEWIETISLSTKKIRSLTKADKVGQMHVMPIADPQNPNGFFYAGSNSGVLNIYRASENSSHAVTNVTTYATSPEIDRSTNQIIYSRLTSEGFKIESSSVKASAAPRTISALQKYPAADGSDAPPAEITGEHNYHGFRYLFPQYLFPWVFFVPNGALFDLTTSGEDPLSHHQYSLDLGYDTRAKSPREELFYSNSSLSFFIDSIFANDYVYLVGLGNTEHFVGATLDTRHFLFPDSNKWTFGPELTYRMTDYPGYLFTEVGPGMVLNYSNITPMRDYQISPEKGYAFTLGYDYFLPQWGNTSYQNIRGLGTIYYAGSPLPKHHVINFKASAWLSPPQPTILTGTQQGGGEYGLSFVQMPFVVRGYPVGEFIGSSLITGNFEYRFPVAYPFSGERTMPLFYERFHGALICDAITVQGGYYDNSTSPATLFATSLGTYYVSTGGELDMDLQVFYAIPVTIKLGGYYAFTQKAFGGFTVLLGFGSTL